MAQQKRGFARPRHGRRRLYRQPHRRHLAERRPRAGGVRQSLCRPSLGGARRAAGGGRPRRARPAGAAARATSVRRRGPLRRHIWVGESVANPAKYYLEQHRQRARLFEALRAHGIGELVFSSTAAVYGEPDRALIDENTPLRADQSLRRLENDGRAGAGRYRRGARAPLRRPALLQRGRRRCAGAHRRGHARTTAT